MNPITSSHIIMNQPIPNYNGYKNWWDYAGQTTAGYGSNVTAGYGSNVTPMSVQAPSYGVYPNNSLPTLPLTPLTPLTPIQPMSLITSLNIGNRGCGCQGKS